MTCIENAVNAWWDLLTLKGSKRASSALQAIRRHLVAHLNQESPLQFWLQQQGQLDRIDYRAPEPVTYSSATFRRRRAKTGGFQLTWWCWNRRSSPTCSAMPRNPLVAKPATCRSIGDWRDAQGWEYTRTLLINGWQGWPCFHGTIWVIWVIIITVAL